MLRYVTSNPGKAKEASAYLGDAVETVAYEYREVQADDITEIAAEGAKAAFEALDGVDPVIVDDAGLFIRAFDGFPGPYSSYVEDTVGVERLWRLVSEEENRRAHFRTILAYTDGDRTETFEGRVSGTIVAPRGEGGFGYDPIFEYNGQTMAEMDTDRKNAISHRGRALATFAEWLADQE